MQVYVARQPIFDRRRRVVAYELLFRSGLQNAFDALDGNQATSRVISDSLLVFDSKTMTRGKRAFINFTRDFLLGPYPTLLPKEWVVIEILESITPDRQVIAACQRLVEAGYTLALDDFVYDSRYDPLLELVKVVKLDFLALSPLELLKHTRRLARYDLKLLAEKVETVAHYQRALDLGFSLFQGYFFSRPVVVSSHDVPGVKLTYLRMLHEINQPDLDIPRLEAVISQDVSLSYKLLRYINSVGFGLVGEVKSLRQALSLLGQDNVQKWASLVALTHLGQDKPDEILVSSLLRAKFCESLAEPLGMAGRSSHLFLMGLFSHLDALLDQPLEQVAAAMPLDQDLKEALIGQKGRLGQVLALAMAYERGDWEASFRHAQALELPEEALPELYLGALDLSRRLELS